MMFRTLIVMVMVMTIINLEGCGDAPNKKSSPWVQNFTGEIVDHVGITLTNISGNSANTTSNNGLALAPLQPANSAAWCSGTICGEYTQHDLYNNDVVDISSSIVGNVLNHTFQNKQVGTAYLISLLDGSYSQRVTNIEGNINGVASTRLQFTEYCLNDTTTQQITVVDNNGLPQNLVIPSLWATQGVGMRISRDNNGNLQLQNFGSGVPECDRTPHAVTAVACFAFDVTAPDLSSVWIKHNVKWNPNANGGAGDVPSYNPINIVNVGGRSCVEIPGEEILSDKAFWLNVTTTSPPPLASVVPAADLTWYGKHAITGTPYPPVQSTCMIDDDKAVDSEYYVHLVLGIDGNGNFSQCNANGLVNIGPPIHEQL